MKDYVEIVKGLILYKLEEWFEFKENWFEAHAIGEYISALSNDAAMKGQPCASFFVLSN